VIDIHKLLDHDLPAALIANAARAQKELGAIFLVTITGTKQESGAWIITALPGLPVSCKRLENEAMADVSVVMRATAFHKLMASPMKAYTAMQLSMTGEMTVEGVPSIAARLEKLLSYVKV
jgi:SCP-2 sterol transfer family